MMNDRPRHSLPRWASISIVLAVAGLLLLPGPWRQVEKVGSTALTPIQMGLSGTGDEIGSIADTVSRVRDLASENRDQQQQIDQLQSQLVDMRELQVENDDLRNLLSMKQRTGPGTLLPVTVIARDDSPYVQAITVDSGTTGGVHQGDIVVTDKGLVGRVETADPTSSKVRLITDINSSVAVRLQGPDRTTGVLRGQSPSDLLVIAYIPQTDTVTPGEVVISSGLGGLFPEGIVVGTVSQVDRNDADPFQVAAVTPAVDMAKIERLYVVSAPPAS